MPDIKISRAKIEDLEKILELNKKLFEFERQFGQTYNLDWTHSPGGRSYFINRIKDGVVLVAEINQEMIGYLCAFINTFSFRSVNPIAELENMYIEDKYQNVGVSTELIQKLIAKLRENGVKRIKVGALVKNNKAINFYKKLGFEDHEIFLERNV